jgi:RNA polymerase sigma factor (sigma-70 family)
MIRELQVERVLNGPARRSAAPDNANAAEQLPNFVDHPSFRLPDADREYDTTAIPPDDESFRLAYMPHEVTCDLARHMHYAAFRWREARSGKEANRWRSHYYSARDRIILGNRKLIFRAVRRASVAVWESDDLISECDVVLIRAVTAYNPWLGVRFSTYAYTCLMRALARRWSRQTQSRSVLPLSAEAADKYASARFIASDPQGTGDPWRFLLRHFCKADVLLSEREKAIIERRYQLAGRTKAYTLDEVGRDLNLSKERVRQIQNDAVEKLRQALLGEDG